MDTTETTARRPSDDGLKAYYRFRPSLASALDERFYSINWLDEQVLSGCFALFFSDKSCILVSERTFPTGAKECHVEVAAGELSELIGPAIAEVERWASERGCIVVTIQSREAWAKIMEHQGYALHQTAIRKEIA